MPRANFIPPSARPTVEPLPRTQRRFLFLSLVGLFIILVPVFVFYASGYRYDFFATEGAITATGGLYISVGLDEGEVYLNEELVRDSRVFRDALYMQGLPPGVERVHVQAPGYHAWVKELPVYPHIVTEAAAFLFPARPHLRPITPYLTSTGTPVYSGVASTTIIAPFASITVPYIATSSKATTTLTRNTEYLYVRGLFGTSSATTTTLINRVVDEARDIFQPSAATTSTTTSLSSATSTITQSDMMLFEREGDVFVRYLGPERSMPYYFCIPADLPASTSVRYKAQVIEARMAYATEQGLDMMATTSTERLCRREIKIDRQWQDIRSFRFFPSTTDLVLLHRKDGIVVTEIDDRAWQNTQVLYPESAKAVVVDGERIFVADGDNIFELLTEIPTE